MTVLQTPQFKQSPTLELHGPSKRWVGYVCFNDNHVEKLDTFYAPLTSYEPMNAFEVRNDHLCAKEFADALSASDPNEGSGDAWLVICVGASADGDQVDEVYDP